MFNFHFIFVIFILEFRRAGAFVEESEYVLPSWIAENPGFKDPQHINSIGTGHGSIGEKGAGTMGWLVFLNEKKGHGIEIELNKLSLESGLDFLLFAPWPLTTKFKQIKLFTGDLDQTLRIQIPNTKTFFVLYNASSSARSKGALLKYRRYGIPLEVDPQTTESPVKKHTVFEVQLKGKSPKDYSDDPFLQNLKEALRAIAGRYCLANNISFNNDIPTQEMVRIRRVSFCPFEWPERDICASIEHSIFVSGQTLSEDQLIKNYELTTERLKDMWRGKSFPELEELGVTVYALPGTTSTIFWWLLITGLILIISFALSFVFWKADKYVEEARPRKNSIVSEEVKKRPKLKLGKLQRIPSFMYDSKKLKIPLEKLEEQSTGRLNGKVSAKSKFESTLKSESSSELPIKNYYGSFLFGSNAAFEDDEGNRDTES